MIKIINATEGLYRQMLAAQHFAVADLKDVKEISVMALPGKVFYFELSRGELVFYSDQPFSIVIFRRNKQGEEDFIFRDSVEKSFNEFYYG